MTGNAHKELTTMRQGTDRNWTGKWELETAENTAEMNLTNGTEEVKLNIMHINNGLSQ